MGEGHSPGIRRYTVQEAADILGITTGAVRSRLSRGTLRSVREGGTVYVLLPADEQRHAIRNVTDTPYSMPQSEREALISAKDETISELRDRIQALEEANRENRRLLAAALERIPALEAPSEAPLASARSAPGSSETVEEVSEGEERAEPHAATGGAREEVSEHHSVDDPPRLRWHVVGVILSILAGTFSFYCGALISRLGFGSLPQYSVAILLLPLVVIPAFFGYRLGRKVRSRRFGLHLVAIGALIVLGNFLLVIGPLDVESGILFSVTPGLVYISAAVWGNAIQRRNRERQMEQRPAGLPPESAAAAQRWTPQQQAIVGLAGTILSALIGLIGTILTVMASGNGG